MAIKADEEGGLYRLGPGGTELPPSATHPHEFPHQSSAALEFLEHLAHVTELLDEGIHLFDGGSASSGDALAAGPVQDLRIMMGVVMMSLMAGREGPVLGDG